MLFFSFLFSMQADDKRSDRSSGTTIERNSKFGHQQTLPAVIYFYEKQKSRFQTHRSHTLRSRAHHTDYLHWDKDTEQIINKNASKTYTLHARN